MIEMPHKIFVRMAHKLEESIAKVSDQIWYVDTKEGHRILWDELADTMDSLTVQWADGDTDTGVTPRYVVDKIRVERGARIMTFTRVNQLMDELKREIKGQPKLLELYDDFETKMMVWSNDVVTQDPDKHKYWSDTRGRSVAQRERST